MKRVVNWGFLIWPANDGFGRACAKLVGELEDEPGRGITSSLIVHLHEPQGGGDVWPYVVTKTGSEYLLRGESRDNPANEWLDILRRVLAGERIY